MPLLAATSSLNWIRVRRAAYSIADQALAVGRNVPCQRRTGTYAVQGRIRDFCVVIFGFHALSGLHNAAILESVYRVRLRAVTTCALPNMRGCSGGTNAMMGLGLTVTFSIIWGCLLGPNPPCFAYNLGAGAHLPEFFSPPLLSAARFTSDAGRIWRQSSRSLFLHDMCGSDMAVDSQCRIFSGFSCLCDCRPRVDAAGVFLGRELPGKAGSGTSVYRGRAKVLVGTLEVLPVGSL